MDRFASRLRPLPLYLLSCAAPISLSAGSLAAGLCLLTATGLLLTTAGRRDLPARPVLWGLLSLVVVYALATAASGPAPSHWGKFVEECWLKLLLVAVPVLAAGRPSVAGRAFGILVAATAAAALYAVWQHQTGWDPLRGRTLVTEFGHVAATAFTNHKLSAGGQFMIVLLVALAWTVAPGEAGRKRHALRCLPVVLLGVALLWTYARGPWLGVCAGLVALALLLSGRRRLVGLLLLAVPLATSLLQGDLRAHLARALSAAANETRLNLWQSSLAGIADRPWLGWGPGNFGPMLAEHEVAGFYNTRAHAHNDLLMHGVNAGVPGVLAALVLYGGVGVVLFVAWRRRGYWPALAALVALVGIAVAGMFQVFQTDDEVELVLFLVLGLGLARPAAGESCTARADVPH